MQNKIKVVQKIALWHQDKVLVLQRAAGDYTRPNAWDLPGGTVDDQTSNSIISHPHWDELKREIVEEIGWDIPIDLLKQAKVSTVQSYWEPDRQLVTWRIGWTLAIPEKISVNLSEEHQGYSWLSHAESQELEFGPGGNNFMPPLIVPPQS